MAPSSRKTSLYDIHVQAGGRMVDFADWLMPVWFSGIKAEHEAVRTGVGMFDVSHMGQLQVSGPDAEQVVDFLVTNDVLSLPPGRALYTPACNADGNIVDDLIVYKRSSADLLLCVNASTAAKDVAHFTGNNPGKATISDVSSQYAQIAVQGPKSYAVLGNLWAELAAELKPFDFVELEHQGHQAMVAGTGYTGEAGYELYVPWDSAPHFWRLFLAAGEEHGIVPAGLGARDTLRLEAKFCLYGNDIDETTNPLEAGLKWTVSFDREFLGREALLKVREEGLKRRLAGFKMLDRGIPRQHCPIVHDGRVVGGVTSGTRSPTLDKTIGLGYIEVPFHKRGTEIAIDIRGKSMAAKVIKTPFYKAS